MFAFAPLFLGFIVGSFLNVLVDRLPKDESVVIGRSHCDKCKKTLAWYDLIPLFSFISLKGKCRYCNTRLSLYYPTIELTTGILFVLVFLFVSKESSVYQVLSIMYIWELLYYLFITSSFIVIFFTDLKYGIIPDKVLFTAILVSFIYILLNTYYLMPILSAVGACLFFLFLFLITKGKGMGFGDVKFAFLMGLVLGFPNIIVGLYVAFLTGALIGCILIIWRKRRMFGTAIPFGPFLVFGSLVAIFFGESISQSFLHMVLP